MKKKVTVKLAVRTAVALMRVKWVSFPKVKRNPIHKMVRLSQRVKREPVLRILTVAKKTPAVLIRNRVLAMKVAAVMKTVCRTSEMSPL